MKRALVGLIGLVLLAACQDSRRGGLPVSGPSFDLSEARFGGNPDLFFSSPLAATPQAGDLNYDVGAANGALAPRVRVCETDGAAVPAGCLVDVTQAVTGSATGLAMTFGTELYQVNWHTTGLNTAKTYRIEIWGLAATFAQAADARSGVAGAAVDGRWLFGWRDIQNSPNVSACSGIEEFCRVKYGQTLPVKVRIEQFIFCPVDRNCAVQFVAAGTNANLEAQLDPTSGAPSAQLFIPGQTGTDFAIAFAPCTPAEDAALNSALDIPLFGPCLKTLTPFSGSLGTAAIVSLCDTFDAASFGLSHSQEHQLALHHFETDLSRVQALPEAWQCTSPTSGIVSRSEPEGLRRFAYAMRDKIRTWATPRPLMAAATMIDRGGGGETGDISSFFKLGLPSKFQYEFLSDASQSGVAGSARVLRAKVTDFFGAPVQNARVRWAAITPPSGGATVLGIVPLPAPTLTDVSGIAQKTVQLSASTGFNVFHASGRGIADDRATGCTIPPSTAAACSGPRAAYDPFLPLKVPEYDAAGVESTVDIAEGTRLPFTIFGCTPGFGTATVDGVFSAAEWACAKTFAFTANVSGGSTPATLYVMNNGTNLYLAVRLQRSATDRVNTLQFNFDNNNNGGSETGDDVLSLNGSAFTDAYMTLKCTNSSQSSCWATDVSGAGTNDGSGNYTNSGGFTTYEVSHPLNTADNTHDFSLSAGNFVGLFVTLQTGSGAAGNTQWPGFRNYLSIKIEP